MPAAAESGLALKVPGWAIFSLPASLVTWKSSRSRMSLRPVDRAARQAAGEDLGQRRQVGPDAVGLPARRRGDTRKPVTTSSKISNTPCSAVSRAQRVQEIRVDRQAAAIGAGRLDDRRGDVALVLLQQPGQRRLVVLVAQQHVAGHRIEHAGGRACRRNGWCGPTSCGRASRGNGS